MPRPSANFLRRTGEKFRNPSRIATPVYHHLNEACDEEDAQSRDLVQRAGLFVEQHMAMAMPVAHWHADVELNMLLDGEMTYLINGREMRVTAGQFAMFWAAIPHRTIDVAPNAPLVCIFVPLMDFLALPMTRQSRAAVMRGDFVSDAEPQPLDFAMAARWVSEWGGADEMRRRLIADEILLRIRRLLLEWPGTKQSDSTLPAADGDGEAKGGPVGRCERLTSLIIAQYAGPLNVERLAAMAGMHPSTANKAFRQVLGLSVNEYIIRYRLAQVMQRLADTDEPIVQVAYGCGFQSQSQFYELFRQRVGTTPRKFRTGMRNKAA